MKNTFFNPIYTRAAGSMVLSATFTALLSLLLTGFSTNVLETYGLALFVWVPFCTGVIAPLVYGFHQPQSRFASFSVAIGSLMILGLGLILFAIEGLICLIMASPLVAISLLLGAMLGDRLQLKRHSGKLPIGIWIYLLMTPALMGWEYAVEPQLPLISVTTTVDIDAPQEVVWNQVVAFSEIAPPTDPLFTSGIAYPLRARIEGQGVGAIRYCEFSTGAFVEPITVWDEPHLLAFSVEEQPVPMKEMSPYEHIEPAHLHDYFVSTRGEFRLTQLPDGKTQLAGTTWYYQRLQPVGYWKLWSDEIIHRIHQRVLGHIKKSCEQQL